MLRDFANGLASTRTSFTSEECRSLARALSGEPANRFLTDMLGHGLGGTRGSWDSSEVSTRLDDPVACLRAMYSRYAFARRGKDRKLLADLAVQALDHALAGEKALRDLSIEDVWDHYCSECEASARKATPDLNRGVVLGLASLAKTIASEKGVSLARYTANSALDHGRIEPIFFSIVELRGVGPKVAAMMLRDWIYAYNVEESVAHRDSIYLQPIDRWTRLASTYLLEEAGADTFPDWILAGKLGKAARNSGVSGIRLNMGLSWLGCQAISRPDSDHRFLELLHGLEA